MEAVLFVERELLLLANGLVEISHLWSRLGQTLDLLSEAFHVRLEALENLPFLTLQRGDSGRKNARERNMTDGVAITEMKEVQLR